MTKQLVRVTFDVVSEFDALAMRKWTESLFLHYAGRLYQSIVDVRAEHVRYAPSTTEVDGGEHHG